MRLPSRRFLAVVAALATSVAPAACKVQPPPVPAVTVTPASATGAPGAQLQFAALVANSTDPRVSWSVAPLGGGSITQSGLYTAPPQGGTFTVRASAEVDAQAIGTATVTVPVSDAGPFDGGSDAGPSDAGAPDAGSDAGTFDAGTSLVFSSFSASPAAISPGQSTTLSWSALNATSFTLQQINNSSQSAVTGASFVASPTASTTYLLTASDGQHSVTLPASVTVRPAAPAPLIEQLALDSSSISVGNATTLRWTVANAAQISITGLGQVAASGAQTVSPTAATTYLLSASGAGGSASAQVSVAVNSAQPLTPVDPGTGDILLTIDTGASVHPISAYIYGYNADTLADSPPGAALLRRGGNRFTAYNWETNASNAGSDANFANDGELGGGSTPAGALAPAIASAKSAAASLLATIPIQGWVAADESGPVDVSAPNIERFLPTAPRKIASFATGPDTTDGRVFDDEFAHALAASWSGSAPLRLSLDNEPDLWSTTHAEIEKSPVTYQELFDKSIGAASAVRAAAPAALLHGPVLSGWAGFVNLQDASDASGRDFVDAYLLAMEQESVAQGLRLLDVLDLHWYSEATGGGVRVTAANNSAAVSAARVQAPRSLWDPNYVETSWITAQSTGGAAIELLPRMLAKLAADFPGTRLALSEYSHGGGDDISGALAEADALGIFGQQGIDSAAYWPLLASEPYTAGAFRIFRDYDGNGAAFGDTSVAATSSDVALVSIYASQDAGHPEKLLAVVINRDSSAHTARLLIHHTQQLLTQTVWQINPANQSGTTVLPQQVSAASALSTLNGAVIALPAMSVSTVVLQ